MRRGQHLGGGHFFYPRKLNEGEQRPPSIRVLRQATALATSVCVLRIYRIVEVSEGPRIQSINVTQRGEFNPACREYVLCDCAQTLETEEENSSSGVPFAGDWLIRRESCANFGCKDFCV